VEITESSSQLLQFSYGVFSGSLVSFFCLLNLIVFIITNYLLEKVDLDLEKKFPRFGKYLNKYLNRIKKVALFYICLDLLLCLIWLSLLIFYSLVIVAQLQSSV